MASTLPFVGWVTAGKRNMSLAIKVGDAVKTITLKLTTNGLIDFGYQSTLRRMLGLVVGDAARAHHVISWNLRWNELVQRAAQGKENIFHMNHPNNGKIVEAWRNAPNHPDYDIRVAAGLQ